MSLTASAASAVLTLLADKPDDGSKRRWEDQLKEQRDLYTQFVISSALGLSAFLTFCVGVSVTMRCGSCSSLIVSFLDLATKMDRTVCCATTTKKCCFAVTWTSGHPFRLDPRSPSDYRRGSAAVCGPRCLCGMFECFDFSTRQSTIANLGFWVVLVFLQVCNPIPLGCLYLRCCDHPPYALQIHRPIWSSWLG